MTGSNEYDVFPYIPNNNPIDIPYLSGIYSIKTGANVLVPPPITPSSSLTLLDAHKELLIFGNRMGHERMLVFNNDIIILDVPPPHIVNEIVTMFTNNSHWDMIIIGNYDFDRLEYTNPVNDIHTKYKYMYEVKDKTIFHIESPYIASHRLMNKVKNNNLSKINTYWFRPRYVTNRNTHLDTPFLLTKVNKLTYKTGFIPMGTPTISENVWTALPNPPPFIRYI